MKKILVLLLAVALLTIALVACGGGDVTTKKPEGTTKPNAETTTTLLGSDNTEEPIETTTEDTTEAVVVATPNMKDPGKIYHEESTHIDTCSNFDEEYLVINTAGDNGSERYCDGDGYLIYAISIADLVEPTISITLRQQYYCAALRDPTDFGNPEAYIKIADFNDVKDEYPADSFNGEGAYVAGANKKTFDFKPYEHQIYDIVYIYICNSNPPTGWGGTISGIDITSWIEGAAPETTKLDLSIGTPIHKTDDMEEVVNVILTDKTQVDKPYIYDNASSINGDHRYCDNSNYIIYTFNIRGLASPSFVINIQQNYKIEVSPDGETWYQVANFSETAEYSEWYTAFQAGNPISHPDNPDAKYTFTNGSLDSGGNNTDITIDPYNVPGAPDSFAGQFFIKISNCFPSNGWGGSIKSITMKYWEVPAAE